MLRVRTVFSGAGGTPYLNTTYWEGESQAEADSAVSAIADFWGVIDGSMDSELTWSTDPEVAQVNPGTGQTEAVYSVTPESGGGATLDDALPFTTQALVRLRTGFFVNGRELRGRIFVPGLTDLSLNDGVLASTTRDIIQGAAETLIAQEVPAMVIWSKTHSAMATISATSVWAEFAVLRSRRPTSV